MDQTNNINIYILNQVKAGNINEEIAYQILKEVNREKDSNNMDIAVIGMACRFPGSDNVEEFWANIRSGSCMVGRFPESRKINTDKYLEYFDRSREKNGDPYAIAGYLKEIDKFDAKFFRLSPKEAIFMEPIQRLLLEVSWEAIEDAGYSSKMINNMKTGVFIGRDHTASESTYKKIIEADDPMNVIGSYASILASRISYILNLKGPCLVLDTACSSGLVSIHEACNSLKNGECETAIAGGIQISCFPLEGALGDMVESSDATIRAFDKDANGTVWGEGVGIVVLKPLKKAIADGDYIHAVIRGSAINNDGRSNGITAPNAKAQEEVIIETWKKSGINPETISYIETHGTGTKLGDPVEIKGITGAFKKYTDKKQFCGVGSVKTNIGHPVAAAGIASLFKVILSMKKQLIPASINFNEPNPYIDFGTSPVFLNDKLTKWEKTNTPRRAGINSFGFSGTNCHLLVEEAPATDGVQKTHHDYAILTFSAKSQEALMKLAVNYKQLVTYTGNINLDSMCYTANTGRDHYNFRAAIVFKNINELKLKLAYFLTKDLKNDELKGIYVGRHEIVASHKQVSESYQKTESDIMNCSLEAAELLKDISNNINFSYQNLVHVSRLYVSGADISWLDLYKGQDNHKMNLPAYPFDKVKFWPEGKINDQVYYETAWVEKDLLQKSSKVTNGSILIFDDEKGLGYGLRECFIKRGLRVIKIMTGDKFEKQDDNTFIVDESVEDYQRLISDIGIQQISQIVHLGTITNKREVELFDDFDQKIVRHMRGIITLCKQLSQYKLKNKIQVSLVSDFVYTVTGDESCLSSPHNAAFFTLGKVISQENKQLDIRCLDIDEYDIDKIVAEISVRHQDCQVAYRKGKRYVEVFRKADMRTFQSDEVSIRESGIYVITGGAGGIGFEIGKDLAERYKANICLINRTKLPERDTWDIILQKGEDEKIIRKIKHVKEIEMTGVKVEYISADISDWNEMKKAFSRLRKKYGAINGIIHCAGIGSSGLITRDEINQFGDVLTPKMKGTWVLNKLTEEDDIDFFVMFSSIASIFCFIGQGEYAIANAYMDCFTDYRNKSGKKSLTINWPAWKETGMAYDAGLNYSRSFNAISTNDAVNAFYNILNRDISRITIGQINYEHESWISNYEFPIEISEDLKQNLLERNKNRYQEAKTLHKENIKLSGRMENNYSKSEKALSEIFASNLYLHEIDIFDSFYDLGIDSIISLKIANMINRDLHEKISLVDLLEYENINKLAAYIDSHGQNEEDSSEITGMVVQRANEKPFGLSNAQKRIWFLQKLNPDMVAYNLPCIIHINDTVNIKHLEKAFDQVLEKHSILKAVITEENGVPMQSIPPGNTIRLEVVTLRNTGVDVLNNIISQQNKKPFDFTSSLMRAVLYSLSEDSHCLYMNFHHILTDGWGINIFCNDLVEVYESLNKGNTPVLDETVFSYYDYIEQQNEWGKSRDFVEVEQYWSQEMEPPLPVLNLPIDYIRPQIQTYNGDFITFQINSSLKEQLEDVGKKHNLTMHMILLSAYFLLLHKITSDEDIIVGFPITGRHTKDIEKTVGLFINTVCIRVNFNNIVTIKDTLDAVKSKSLSAYKNSRYPFEKLVAMAGQERDLAKSPVFSAMFQFSDNTPPANEGTTQYEISLLCKENNGAIDCRLEFNTDLFKKETVTYFVEYCKSIINELTIDVEKEIVKLELLSKDMLSKVELMYSGSKFERTQEYATVQEQFEAQCGLYGHLNALVCENETLTYRELNEKSNRLAHVIRKHGIKPDMPVGIMAGRNINTIIGLLAILKSGGAYVPLDPGYPTDRLSYMLHHSEITVLLTESAYSQVTYDLMKKPNSVECIIDISEEPAQQIITEKRFLNMYDIQRAPADELSHINKGNNLMYCIYTSGSTGVPKGVMVTHANAMNFLSWSRKDAGLASDDTIMLVTSINFDISVFEIFGALLSGMRLVIVPEDKIGNPYSLLDYMKKSGVTIWHSVPTLLLQLMTAIRNGRTNELPKVRRFMIGGEAWSTALAKEVRKFFPDAKIVNMYGPTETTIWVSSYEIGVDLEKLNSIPIGKPIDNNKMIILDSEMKPCGVSISGDIYISGANVTKGYFKDENKTSEVFISVNKEGESQILYKSGDIGRLLSDGNIEFLGRKDGMVKVHGYRIEIGEIENALHEYGDISDSAVVVRENDHSQMIVCFYVSDNQMPEDVRVFLQSKLAGYMIPSRIVRLEAIPLTPNKKVDKKLLSSMEIKPECVSNTHDLVPQTETEKYIAEVWKKLLHQNQIYDNDNFFTIGGDSFMVTNMYVDIESMYPGIVKIVDIFKYPTISKLSRYIDMQMDDGRTLEIRTEEDRKLKDQISTVIDEYDVESISIDDAIHILNSMENDDE